MLKCGKMMRVWRFHAVSHDIEQLTAGFMRACARAGRPFVYFFDYSFINSNKETDKNTGPLVHPVMTPPSITPVGVSKFQQN